MKTAISKLVDKLKNICIHYDEQSNLQTLLLLEKLSGLMLSRNKIVIQYVDVLLFICAHPANKIILDLAEKELTRITLLLKSSKIKPTEVLANSGLPYTKSVSRFSHDCVDWLLSYKGCHTEINSFKESSFELNEVLKLTLPTMERSETTAGLNNDDLLDVLLVKKQNQLSFLINELRRLNDQPYVKDHLYDGLGIYVNIIPKDHLFSKAFNRFILSPVYFHSRLIKHFDHVALLNSKLPPAAILTTAQRNRVVNTIKISMALTDRETDPTTYLDKESLKLFELEHGISIAIYGMIPNRQLPLESFVGYTLFKNGFPAAYGGGWVFGERSNFGINIFESFRGGESGYMMCQLLRVYKQEFSVNYFEVEPYQYGLDNPEGIDSGAFWFYHRYGFRPLDKHLFKICKEEHRKIVSKKGYRTSRIILEKFTESNIALNFGKIIPIKVPDITTKVSRMIQKKYNGNRLLAEQESEIRFKIKTGWKYTVNNKEKLVLTEVALLAEAFEIDDKIKLNLLTQMVKIKPIDLYNYQQLLLQFFRK